MSQCLPKERASDSASLFRHRSIDLRLAVPAATAWALLAVALGLPDALNGIAVAAWSATAALVAFLRFRPRVVQRLPWLAVIALACCATAVLMSSAAVRAPARSPEALTEAATASRYVTATAETTTTVFAGTSSFTVTISEVDVGGEKFVVSVPARAFGEPAGAEFGIGSLVRLRGTLASTQPGDDIAFLLFTSEAPEQVEHPPPLFDWANVLRDDFRTAAAALPGDGGALLPGLAIGDTSAVAPDLDDAMKSSSLSHLTAVSGANCAIVIALVMLITARLRMSRVWRVAFCLVVLAGFVVIVTPEPSVMRAAVMAVLALSTSLIGRGGQGLPMLALAVLVLLVGDPWLARDYGFTLSVMATGGLLLLCGPLTRVLSKVLPTPIAAALAIPLAAQIACQPVLILLAPSIPLFGVIANVLAGPAAPAATIIGLIACLVLPIAPTVGSLIAQLAWVPAAWIAATARYFAELPGSRLDFVDGWPGVAMVTVVTALALVALLSRRRTWRVTTASVLSVLAVVSGGAVVGTAVRTNLSRPADWQIAMCDIGQGDASLVRDGPNIAVIDTGPDPDSMTRCLDDLGVDRVDLLVLTHFDLDHVGGASALVGRADRVLVGPEDRPEAERLVGELREGGSVIEQVRQGDTGSLGALDWRVLWPPARLAGIEPGNDASVTLLVSGGGTCVGCLSAMFLGDLGEEAQNRLMGTVSLPEIDVVKVAHHGSNDQSALLYERVSATVGLIGVGAENDYGHPTDELLEILKSTETTAVRTDVEGLALLAPGRDGRVVIWTEKGG